MPSRDSELKIDRFLGVNRRDGADLVDNKEFYTLQNWYQKTRGLFHKRYGTTNDFQASDLPLASTILGFHRQVGLLGDYYTLLYCQPTGTIVTPTAAPTLSDITSANGDLFNGGATASITIGYSWVGCGGETLISPTAAITVASNTNKIRVTIPAFPAGVVSANVQRSIGGNPIIVGVITSSAGTVDLGEYIEPTGAASTDTVGIVNCTVETGGSLKRGVYYLSVGWLTAAQGAKLAESSPTNPVGGNEFAIISVPDDGYKIRVQNVLAAAASTNGATWAYVFIGLKDPNEAPMIFAGMVKAKASATAADVKNSLYISSLPSQSNLLSYPAVSSGNKKVQFYNGVLQGASGTAGSAYITRLNSGNAQVQLFFPRLNPYSQSRGGTNYDDISPFTADAYVPIYLDSSSTNVNTSRRRIIASNVTPYFASFGGLCFIANNYNLLLQVDGISVSEIREYPGTIQPGYPSRVILFKDQLVVVVNASQANAPASSNKSGNQVYGSNALSPYNWSSGGTGTALRFATVGDPFGDGVTVLGAFSYTTDNLGPKSYLLMLKKAGVYLLSNIPDQASGVAASADTLSARTGSLAQNSIANTPLGTIFLGTDGDIYLVNGTGEPKRIGSKVQSFFDHLVGQDTLAAYPSAVYHDNQYKLAYPSSASSTGNDAQLWADLRTDLGLPIVWTGPHTGVSIAQQEVYNAITDNGRRMSLKPDQSGLQFLDDSSTFSDLGTTITAVMQWKTTRSKREMYDKLFRGIFFDCYYDTQYSHSVLIEGFAGDQYSSRPLTLSEGTAIWDSSSWGLSNWGDAIYQGVVAPFGPDNLVGRTISWKLTHANAAQFIVASAVMNLKIHRRNPL